MKQLLTLVFIGLTSLYAQNRSATNLRNSTFSDFTESQSNVNSGPETVIWSETFANGIPAGWSTSGTAVGTLNTNAVWVYRGPNTTPSNATGSRGAYAGTVGTGQLPILSPTASNGFVIFDSDFLDNNGIAGNFCGTGALACAPHVSTLTTSSINLQQNSMVELRFNQYYRRFAGAGGVQTVPATYVDISTNGGTTWTNSITLNSNIVVNSATARNSLISVDISQYAGNQSNVKLRFRFDGDYYFWQVDDIEIVSMPKFRLSPEPILGKVDGKSSSFSFSQSNECNGVISYRQISSLLFNGNVKNYGTNALANLKLQVKVYRNNQIDTILLSSTQAALLAGITTYFNINSNYIPTDTGVYSLQYTILSDSATTKLDSLWFKLTKNQISSDFGVVSNLIGSGTNTTQWGTGSGVRQVFNLSNDTLTGIKVGIGSATLPASLVVSINQSNSVTYNLSQTDITNGFAYIPFSTEIPVSDSTEVQIMLNGIVMLKNDATVSMESGRRQMYLAVLGSWYSGYSNSDLLNRIHLSLITKFNATCPITAVPTVPAATTCGPQAVTLSATWANPANQHIWLSPTGVIKGRGNTFTTPVLTASATQNSRLIGRDNSVNAVSGGPQITLTNPAGSGGNFTNGMWFTATQPFMLDSVTVRAIATATGGVVKFLVRISEKAGSKTGNTGAQLYLSDTITVSTTLTTGQLFRVPVNIPVLPGSYYVNINFVAGTTGQLFRSTALPTGTTYPYPLGGLGSLDSVQFGITGSNARIYYLFNWKMSAACLGPIVTTNVTYASLPSVTLPQVSDFTTGAPCNWVATAASGATWQGKTGYTGNGYTATSLNGTPFVMVDDDAAGSSASTPNSVLTTPSFPALGYDTLTLKFKSVFKGGTWGGKGYVEIWKPTNGVFGWQTIDSLSADQGIGTAATGWAAVTKSYNVTAYQSNQFKARFRYNDKGNWAGWWAMDDFQLYGTLSQTGNVRVAITTDIYGTEVSWKIVNTVNKLVYASKGPFNDVNPYAAATATHIDTVALPLVGQYEFRITDAYGDGLIDGTNTGTYLAQVLCPNSFKIIDQGSGALPNDPGGSSANVPSWDSAIFDMGCSSIAPPTTIPSIAYCQGAVAPQLSATALSGATLKWFDGQFNPLTQAPIPSTAVSGVFTYYVGQLTLNGLSAIIPIVVTVNPLPVVNAGTDVTVCAGTPVTLSGSGASTYTWNNAVSNAVAFTPTATTTYTVTGTDAIGCVNTDQVVVTVNPLPVVNAGTDLTVCAGTPVTLSGSGASTYTWNNAVSNAVAFTPTATTTYTVTGTNANGCVNTDQVLVTVNALPLVGAGADVTVCAGTAVTLSGSGASTYSWNNAVSNAVAFTPTASATYTVTGTNANGCVNTDQVLVTVNPVPVVNAGADVTVCAGTAVTLSGSGASTYTWNNGVTNAVAFTPTASATYTVTGNANGCVNTDSLVVTVNAMPDTTVTITGSLAFCPGSSVTLTAVSGLGYLWSTGNTGQNIVLSQSATVFAVVATVNGCIDTTASFTTTLFAGADTSVTASNLIFCASDSSVITAAAGQSYLWSTSDTTQSITVNQTGNYAVTVTTVNGCVGVSDTVATTVVPDVVLPQILGNLYGWFASGDTVNFSVVNNLGYTLNWGITGGVITGGQGGDTIAVIWGAADSTAAIWVVVSNGVCQDSAYLNLVISGLGTGEGIGSKAMAYPNPNSGVFTLEWSNIDAQQVLIYNGVGQVVASQPIAQGSTSTVIDLSAKAAGIYRAVIYGIEGTVTLPVYVRH